MSGADGGAVALSFFDEGGALHGTIRTGLTLVFEGREARPEQAEAAIEREGDGWRGRAGEAADVLLQPVADPADLAGVTVQVCSAAGTVAGRRVSGLGTVAVTRRAPDWEQLESLRALSALFTPDLAVLAVARRPRAARGHGDELVTAAFLEAGELRTPEDARISTVYDGGGRHRSAGLELWFPGEDYPRRLFGTVQAGTSLALEELAVHAAAFTWRMEGRRGSGMYELTVRAPADEPVAA